MNLNADFTRRAVVHAATLDWKASPMPGVERRMLDRIGDEVARATTIVRYAPQSSHTPGSKPGCTMFVKLWQFDPADRTHVRLDTNQMAPLDAKERDGVKLMPLFKDAHEDVRLKQGFIDWPTDASGMRRQLSPAADIASDRLW
jgi:anti-sigma factor ChrR (cupin superfamily)